MCTPFEMMRIASSFLSALSVNSALNLLCRGIPPDLFRRVSSRFSRSESDTMSPADMVNQEDGHTAERSRRFIFLNLSNW